MPIVFKGYMCETLKRIDMCIWIFSMPLLEVLDAYRLWTMDLVWNTGWLLFCRKIYYVRIWNYKV